MAPLDELQKIRAELADSLKRADSELLAGKKPMLSRYDRGRRTALLKRVDADIERLIRH